MEEGEISGKTTVTTANLAEYIGEAKYTDTLEISDFVTDSAADQFRMALDEVEANAAVKDRIEQEISRFNKSAKQGHENAALRRYIETLLAMPWGYGEDDYQSMNIAEVVKALDKNHYGMKDVKSRIIEVLSSWKYAEIKPPSRHPIICLVGPPGVGKTTIALSIAEALGRDSVQIALGGVDNEGAIRGYDKAFGGAPGRIAQGLLDANAKRPINKKRANPVMILDEIEKVSSGAPFYALLEVLDHGQNRRFRDRYIEIPLDLSQVFFICTANERSKIPEPLEDRMEIIEIGAYTEEEKHYIATKLIRKLWEDTGLDTGSFDVDEDAIREIISGYTREAGVRELRRVIERLFQKVSSEKLVDRTGEASTKINSGNLEWYLGKPKYKREKARKKAAVGTIAGLYVNVCGGGLLEIEAKVIPGGKGKLKLTGRQSDFVKEACTTALSYVRSLCLSPAADSRYRKAEDFFATHDFHIHFPGPAIKDGNSGGIATACAILSAVIEKPIRSDLAMTGEITLSGEVWAIGGLEGNGKLVGAKMAGIKTVLIPKKNENDISRLDKEVTDSLEIIFVETMSEVLEHVWDC
jgi:ATP-dependent Lon protease